MSYFSTAVPSGPPFISQLPSRYRPGVNFTNILRMAFFNKSIVQSFFCTYILGLHFFGA
jgi:hypothetical protein